MKSAALMNSELPSVSDYTSLQHWLNEYCENKPHPCWHNYGPADFSLYQSDPVKILLVGAESGGYDKCENVPPEEYLRWIRDGHKTPRYSSVFIAMIRDYIALLAENKAIPPFQYNQWSRYYQDYELLIERMRATIYTNARITSNGTGSSIEDKARVLSDVVEFAPYRKRFVEILDPRIVICAGDSAAHALFIDGGAFQTASLRDEPVFVLDNHICVMTSHLSRPNGFGGYAALHQTALQCATFYSEKDWTER